MAHPVAPTADEVDAWRGFMEEDSHATALQENMRRALRWLAWLRASFPETTFIAPWIATIESLEGNDTPVFREAGLVDDCAVVERCDGIVLVGGRISSGMRREMEHGVANHLPDYFRIYDLTGSEVPAQGTIGTFAEWASGMERQR
jgi:hypothetical protein